MLWCLFIILWRVGECRRKGGRTGVIFTAALYQFTSCREGSILGPAGAGEICEIAYTLRFGLGVAFLLETGKLVYLESATGLLGCSLTAHSG